MPTNPELDAQRIRVDEAREAARHRRLDFDEARRALHLALTHTLREGSPLDRDLIADLVGKADLALHVWSHLENEAGRELARWSQMQDAADSTRVRP